MFEPTPPLNCNDLKNKKKKKKSYIYTDQYNFSGVYCTKIVTISRSWLFQLTFTELYLTNMAPVNQAFKAPEEVFSHAPATSVSPGCRWTIRLSSVHGSCCCCPKTQSQSASWKHCTSRESGPGQGIGIVPASAAPGGTSCESSGLSRSRKCS